MSDEECYEEQPSFEIGTRAEGVVRYGNTIVLQHQATGNFLNSDEYSYESGSYQQRVFANGGDGEAAEWLVLPALGSEEQLGNEVGFDDQFRLKHVQTGRFLHSHPGIESPVTSQQEVTGFGGDDETDENDVWRLEAFPDYEYPVEDYLWHLGIPLVVRHLSTGATLHSHPIEFADSNEVTAYTDLDENDMWSAC